MHTFIAYDPHDIPRVFATDENWEVAERMCHEEIRAYVRERPDTAPVSQWTIHASSPKQGDK